MIFRINSKIAMYRCFIFLIFSLQATSKISIITSVYKADEFIEQFLQEVVQQTIFNQCELILINAGSPGNEEGIIQTYVNKYSNIRYVRLEEDPGLYAVWNVGVQMAQGAYITNLNVDDRINYDCYEVFSTYLNNNKEIDLVYAPYLITYKSNEIFNKNSSVTEVNIPEFSIENSKIPLPSFFPLWRKSVHEKIGYFDETFKVAGDWEFWLRMVGNGMLFKKVSKILGLYYCNPQGLSTIQNKEKQMNHTKERIKIFEKYKHLWNCKDYKEFSKKFNLLYWLSCKKKKII